MPKKILFESARTQFLRAAKEFEGRMASIEAVNSWRTFVDSIEFRYLGNRKLELKWTLPHEGSRIIDTNSANFYVRGDLKNAQKLENIDSVARTNADFFSSQIESLVNELALEVK